MGESDEQKRLLEAVLYAEENNRWGFNYSTLYLNEFGPAAAWLIEDLLKKADYIRSRKQAASEFIASRLEARAHAMRMGLIATRSRDGRFNDVITIQRQKMQLSSPEQARGMAEGMKKMMGMGGGSDQGQQGGKMF